MSEPIRCDSGGCYGEAEWKDQRGNRWCAICKRGLAAFTKAHGGQAFVFRREQRSAPSTPKSAVDLPLPSSTPDTP